MGTDFLNRWIAPLVRRVRLMVGRGVVRLVNDAAGLQRLQIDLLAGETIGNLERFQEYGFTSYPFAGAECAVGFVAGDRSHGLVLAVDDRRYRIHLQQGEAAIYDDQGQIIKLARGGIEMTAPMGTTHTGDMTINGKLNVTDLLTAKNIDIPAGGDITIGGISFNGHAHGGVQPGSGVSGGPQ